VYELGTFAVVYFECRQLVVDGAVLQVRLAVPIQQYGDALPAVEALLAGVQVHRLIARAERTQVNRYPAPGGWRMRW
jgi:hypothetical protein